MLQNFWKKKKQNEETSSSTAATPGNADSAPSGKLTWDDQAKQALEQSVSQAPVPKLMKGRVRKELQKAAEEAARKAGHTEVTAQDLMTGLMDKLPGHMKKQIEDAAKQGPAGLKALEKKFRRK